MPLLYPALIFAWVANAIVCDWGNGTDQYPVNGNIRDACEECQLVNPRSTIFQCQCRGNTVEGDLQNFLAVQDNQLHISPKVSFSGGFYSNCTGPMGLGTVQNATYIPRKFVLSIICLDSNGVPSRMGTIDIGASDKTSHYNIRVAPAKPDRCYKFEFGCYM